MEKWNIRKNKMLPVIFALAWPTMLEQFLQTAVQYIDTAMVGSLGTQATAAVGSTSTVNWLIGSTVSAIGVGLLAFISQSFGAGNRERAKRASGQAVLVVLAVLPFIFSLVTGTVGSVFGLAVALAAILVVLGLMTVLVFVGGIMLFVLGTASLFEHFAMGLMFIGLGIAAEGSCLLLICGCILFYGVFLPWAVKGIIQLCRQAAGYLSARA